MVGTMRTIASIGAITVTVAIAGQVALKYGSEGDDMPNGVSEGRASDSFQGMGNGSVPRRGLASLGGADLGQSVRDSANTQRGVGAAFEGSEEKISHASGVASGNEISSSIPTTAFSFPTINHRISPAKAPSSAKSNSGFVSYFGLEASTEDDTEVRSAVSSSGDASDSPTISLSASSSVITEGESVTLTASLSEISSDDVTVEYLASSGTAGSGTDFDATSGTLTIAAGELSGSIVISTTDDSVDESDETFSFALSNPSGAALSSSTVTLTIRDTDEYFDFTTGSLDSSLIFSRSSSGTYFDSSGVMQVAAADAPRFDYDPSNCAGGACAIKGLLVEPMRENVALNSTTLNGAPWSTVRATIIQEAASAPDGSNTVGFLREDTAFGAHGISTPNIAGSANQAWTLSFYVKPNGRTRIRADIRTNGGGGGNLLSTWTLSGAGTAAAAPAGHATTLGKQTSIQALPNGWYRCVLSTSRLDATANLIYLSFGFYDADEVTSNYTGNGASGYYLWGMQLEQGETATSYIPTGATAVTRQADVVEIYTSLTFGSGWSAILDFTRPRYEHTDNTGTVTLFSACDTSAAGTCATDANVMSFKKAANEFEAVSTKAGAAGSQSTYANGAALTEATVMQVGLVRSAADKNTVYVNGAAAAAGVASTSPATSNFVLGGGGSSAASYEKQLNGHMRKFTFRSRALTSAQMTALTLD